MRAELDDAPEYFQTRRKKNGIASVMPWLAGTVISIGMLYILSTVVLGQAVKNLSSAKQANTQNKPAELIRLPSISLEPKDKDKWDRIVEEQARRDAGNQLDVNPATAESAKLTVFNDNNYIPQGAINIVQAPKFEGRDNTVKPKPRKEIVIVGKADPRISDYCGGKAGSVERRNCKATMNLNSR